MGAWQEIVDYTVPSNTTSVVLDSFGTITKDDFIKIVTTIDNQSGSANVTGLYPNGQTTDTHYHAQVLYGSSSSTGALRYNENYFTRQGANDLGSTFAYLKLSQNDRLNIFANRFQDNDSAVVMSFDYTTSSGVTFPSGITSFTWAAKVANGLGAGSRIQIYKLAAEKVADITVASNTTQVDISNLSIDKDSEYLLVSDISPSATTNIVLGVNDVTATNQYYYQVIAGIGSTTYAVRENQGLMIYLPSGRKGLLHSHIKLSNIGAFTAQNYSILDYGTSTPELLNRFQSSTAENITSITKLNILAQTTNGIAAGSRFMLYKLY